MRIYRKRSLIELIEKLNSQATNPVNKLVQEKEYCPANKMDEFMKKVERDS